MSQCPRCTSYVCTFNTLCDRCKKEDRYNAVLHARIAALEAENAILAEYAEDTENFTNGCGCCCNTTGEKVLKKLRAEAAAKEAPDADAR